MQDMMRMYGMGDASTFAPKPTLILNNKNALVKYVEEHSNDDEAAVICEQLYDLAMLSNQPLSTEAMAKFVERSQEIMLKTLG